MKVILIVCSSLILVVIIARQLINQKNSLVELSPCEKSIKLFDKLPDDIVSNEKGYTILYKYVDEFPSKKSFESLQNQLENCGWKAYNPLEFAVNDPDWVSYIGLSSTVKIHRFARTYIDQSGRRTALIILEYYSKVANMNEAIQLHKPNNNMQHITLQFMNFDKEDYKKAIEVYNQKHNTNNIKN